MYLDTDVPKGCPKSNEERAMELMINSGFARAEVDRYRKERGQNKVVTRWLREQIHNEPQAAKSKAAKA